ncbi:MAG TPA: carbon-phosphorus lyase complex subunit PhnI, partial [Rhodospirillaceae bacterium]|nr:carbon-phosphorus lyase complex subunit PhnI [Rhodospirillaceae bacterium]
GAVKGGERAIRNSHKLIAEKRRGDKDTPELTIAQIKTQMRFAVHRVMTEGSLYDPDLAALAIKQACGDLVEAIFLLRAFRTTLPRLAMAEPIDTNRMNIQRRVSALYKDIPGGQVLGPTFDYTHRLLDFQLMAEGGSDGIEAEMAEEPVDPETPQVMDILDQENVIEREIPDPDADEPYDLTRESLSFPADRDQRLQNLVRGDEGFVLALGYSTQRGFGGTHPFAGEVRYGKVEVEIIPEELGFPIVIGEIEVTECQMVTQFKGSKNTAPQFTRGYGIAFGHSERKAMGMSLVDRALRSEELGEEAKYPAQSPEFVLYHSDNVEASGFVQHLKLPHYVDFQTEMQMIRGLRQKYFDRTKKAAAE